MYNVHVHVNVYFRELVTIPVAIWYMNVEVRQRCLPNALGGSVKWHTKRCHTNDDTPNDAIPMMTHQKMTHQTMSQQMMTHQMMTHLIHTFVATHVYIRCVIINITTQCVWWTSLRYFIIHVQMVTGIVYTSTCKLTSCLYSTFSQRTFTCVSSSCLQSSSLDIHSSNSFATTLSSMSSQLQRGVI